MIVLLVTNNHEPTTLESVPGVDVRIRTYHRAFRSSRLRLATYVFCDLDRLSFWELEVAAHLYRELAREGARVLNDPARARQRFGLLRTLKEAGINSFDVWRVADTGRPDPDRYPVFLRTEAAHRGPISGLLEDAAAIDAAIRDALDEGYPRRELLLVEFRGEPVRDGLYRKLGTLRLGERLVPCLNAHDRSWAAKVGVSGIADEEMYRDEQEVVRTNRHAEDLWPAFRAAEIEYGRADFAVVDGRVEVYEINTNPSVKRLESHPYPLRLETDRLVWEQLAEALEAVDTPKGGRIALDAEVLDLQRYHDRWMTRPRWIP